MADTLRELQRLLASSYGVPAMQVEPDCPLSELGLDAVGLNDLVAAMEDTFEIVASLMTDEEGTLLTLHGDLLDRSLRELADCVDRLRAGRSGSGD